MTTRITFGMISSRVDDEIVDEVIDAVDSVCGDDDDWDVISWRRTSSTRFLMYAPIKCRSVVYQSDLELKAMSQFRLLKDMRNSYNQWNLPETDSNSESLDEAEEIVQEWTQDTCSPENLGMTEKELRVAVPAAEPVRPKLTSVSTIKESPKEDLLKAFGLPPEMAESDWFVLKQESGDSEESPGEDTAQYQRGSRGRTAGPRSD